MPYWIHFFYKQNVFPSFFKVDRHEICSLSLLIGSGVILNEAYMYNYHANYLFFKFRKNLNVDQRPWTVNGYPNVCGRSWTFAKFCQRPRRSHTISYFLTYEECGSFVSISYFNCSAEWIIQKDPCKGFK